MKVKIIFKDQTITDKILDGYLAEHDHDPDFLLVIGDEVHYSINKDAVLMVEDFS